MSNTLNTNTIARNSIFMSVRMVIVLLISLYTTRLVLATLGVTDYGIYNVVCGFVSMFMFLNTSMSNGIQRFFNYELGKNGIDGARKVFNIALRIQLALSITVIFIVETIGVWFLRSKMVIPDDRMFAAEWVFQCSVISMLFLIIQAPYVAAIIGHEKMDFYSVIGIVDVVLKLLIVLALPLFRGDLLIIYGFLFLLISIINFALYYFYTRKQFPEISIIRISDKIMLKEMLSFSGWNLFGSFSLMMREQGINMILNLYFGPVLNAARGIAQQINGALEGFASNLVVPVRPQVIQSYAVGNAQRSLNLSYCVSKLSVYFVLVLAIPVTMEINFILRLWLGSNVPTHTNTFVVIVMATTIVNLLMGTMAAIVHATGEMKNYQLIGSFVKLLCVPSALILLGLGFAPEWAMISVFFFNLFGFFIGLYIIQNIFSFRVSDYYRKVLVPIIIVFILSIIVVWPIMHFFDDDWLRFIISFVVSCTWTGLCAFFIGLNANEKLILRSLVKNFITKIRR